MRIAFLMSLIVLLIGACGDSVRVAQAPPAPEPPDPRPAFEQLLDSYGVPFAPPRTGKAILVNIPAYEAIAFEDGEPVIRSRVIVGTTRTRTPIKDTYTTAVRFRPTWRPTPSMIASGEYEDRVWPSGPRNPLGLAAIRMEPGMLVYMHDTNRRGLFQRETRALSHGCVRTERWDELAAWLLDVDVAQIHAWADGRRTFDAPTPTVPVMIRYYTAFPGPDGRLEHHPDIYRLGPTPLAPAAGARDIAASLPQFCEEPVRDG
jgi:murein L,D-transpeptidase YcbB/YkuD